MKTRPLTDAYLAAVALAVGDDGREWIEVRTFATEANARVTASCLEGGFLRVTPREGDAVVRIGSRQWIATAAPFDTLVCASADGWKLLIRRRSDQPAS